MQPVTQETLLWPFRDAEWKKKFLVGSLMILISFFVPGIGLAGYPIVYGYCLLIMRGVMRGEPPTLPKWEDFGALFVDGLKGVCAAIGYLTPAILLMLCSYAVLFIAIFSGTIVSLVTLPDRGQITPGMGLPLLIGYLGFFISFMPALALMLVCFIPTPVAVGQYVRTGRISGGYRWREVWAILRANASGFLVAWILYWAIGAGLSFAVSMLYYTIILCCLVPFLLAPVLFYPMLLWAMLFGSAYRLGVEKAGIASLVS